MKNKIIYAIILLVTIDVTSCKQKENLPPPVANVEEATKLLTGKTWQLVDVATISGSRKSVFNNDNPKTEEVLAPPLEALNWFSAKKGIDTATDFINSFYKENFIKFKKISISFNKDSVATTTGLDANKQIFSITNTVKENEPKGIKLTLTGDSKMFEEMGVSKTTITYYILGANDKNLYLLTPNEINDLKVVFLLASK